MRNFVNETARTLYIKRVHDVETLETLRDEWNGLLDKNGTKTAELTFEWQMSHWKYSNKNTELFVLVVRDDNSIAVISPLKLTTIRRVLNRTFEVKGQSYSTLLR